MKIAFAKRCPFTAEVTIVPPESAGAAGISG
jgi:hypothetical protein